MFQTFLNYVMAVDRGAGGYGPHLWFFNINSPTRVPKISLYRKPEGIVMYNSELQPMDVSGSKQFILFQKRKH